LNQTETDMVVVFDLDADLPLQADELKLMQDLLPELLQDMRWLQDDKE
jgi:hypothetical protein